MSVCVCVCAHAQRQFRRRLLQVLQLLRGVRGRGVGRGLRRVDGGDAVSKGCLNKTKPIIK